jgi:hypothetical protein
MQHGFKRAPRQNPDDSAWEPADPMLGDNFGLDDFDPDAYESSEMVAQRSAPSLPIILFSAASGVSGSVIGFFISNRWLELGVELSAGVATLALLFSLGISGAVLSALTGSRAAPVNIFFSCGVILLALFFLGLCVLVGALFGTLIVQL